MSVHNLDTRGEAAVRALRRLAEDLGLRVAGVADVRDVEALGARIREAVAGKVARYVEPGVQWREVVVPLQVRVRELERELSRAYKVVQ